MILENISENKKNNLCSFLVTMEICFPFISVLNENLFSLFNSISLYFFLAITICIFLLQNNIEKNFLTYIFLVAIYLFGSALLNSGGIGSCITFLLPLCMLYCFSNVSLKIKQIRLIKNLCFFIILYLVYISKSYAANWIYYRYNGINPNSMAFFLNYALVYFFVLSENKKFRSKIIKVILFLLSVFAFINYEARGGIVVFLLFVGLCMCKKVINKKGIIILNITVVLFSVAFPFIYLNLYRNGYDFVLFNKTLYTGRESIWLAMVNSFNEHKVAWLIGLGSKVELWTGHNLNVHNNAFAVIVNFGLIGFIVFYTFVLNALIQRNYDNDKNKMLTFGFLCLILVWGILEVTTLWSTTFSLAFLMLSLNVENIKGNNIYGKNNSLLLVRS